MKRKIVIVGDGFVGSTTLYTMMLSDTAEEYVLIDINRNKAEGDVLDINHGISFINPEKVYVGGYPDCKDAAVVVLTAGVAQRPGESRNDLLERNKKVFDAIIDEMMPHIGSETVLLVVTNPVDVLTRYTLARSGLTPNRVIGSGTVLDTSRLKYAISRHTNIDTRNVHTYIIGEHGDTEVPVFSNTTIAGMSLPKYCAFCGQCADAGVSLMDNMHREVREAAAAIIEKKGATYYAVALAVNRIVQAILNDQNSILTVSSYIDGPYGLKDVCISLPSVVNRRGVDKIIEVTLSEDELARLRASAESVRSYYA